MKVLVIGGYAPSLLNFRGPLLSALASRGHDVVACAPEIDDEVRAGIEALGARAQQIPLTRAGIHPGADFRTYRALRGLIRAECPARILAYTAKPVIYGNLAAGRRFRVHSMITGLGYAFGTASLRQRLVGGVVRRLYRGALSRSDGIFFQNPDDRALFERYRLVPRHVPVTMINGSGVDLEWYRPQPLPEEPVFLLVARLLADKGISEYVEAARRLKARWPAARFQLAGWMDPNPMNVQPEELAGWQRSGVIEYLGHLDDVRPAYAGCRVYVLPSYREGTPRTVLEAMATGRPVVTTDAPGCRETVVDGESGLLVPVQDSDALERAMERFLAEPALAGRMGAKALARVREKYDVNKVNQVILDAMEL